MGKKKRLYDAVFRSLEASQSALIYGGHQESIRTRTRTRRKKYKRRRRKKKKGHLEERIPIGGLQKPCSTEVVN